MVNRDDDGERFSAWAKERMPALLRFGSMLTGDRASAEDLVQTALARTWAAWPRVRTRDDPEGYVRRVMVNAQISEWRRHRGRAPATTAGTVDDAADAVGDRAVVAAALRALAPRQRAVVVLRYCEDRSVEE